MRVKNMALQEILDSWDGVLEEIKGGKQREPSPGEVVDFEVDKSFYYANSEESIR